MNNLCEVCKENKYTIEAECCDKNYCDKCYFGLDNENNINFNNYYKEHNFDDDICINCRRLCNYCNNENDIILNKNNKCSRCNNYTCNNCISNCVACNKQVCMNSEGACGMTCEFCKKSYCLFKSNFDKNSKDNLTKMLFTNDKTTWNGCFTQHINNLDKFLVVKLYLENLNNKDSYLKKEWIYESLVGYNWDDVCSTCKLNVLYNNIDKKNIINKYSFNINNKDWFPIISKEKIISNKDDTKYNEHCYNIYVNSDNYDLNGNIINKQN